MAQTTVHIPKILHFYRHDAATTAAPELNVPVVAPATLEPESKNDVVAG
jgi:hypothetical protein